MPSLRDIEVRERIQPRYVICQECGQTAIIEAVYADNGSVDHWIYASAHDPLIGQDCRIGRGKRYEPRDAVYA